MNEMPDSLTSLVNRAIVFLREDVGMTVTDQEVQYILVYHFDSFNSAYQNYRLANTPSSRQAFEQIVMRVRSDKELNAHIYTKMLNYDLA